MSTTADYVIFSKHITSDVAYLMVGDCWRLEGLLLIGVVTTHSAGHPPGSPLKALFASCLCAISVFSQRRHLLVHVQPATSSQS